MLATSFAPAEVMSALLNRSLDNQPPRAAALPEMATAVLILSEDRHVEYANSSASAMFLPHASIGETLAALFAKAGAVSKDRFFAAIDAGAISAELRLQLADGRLMDGTLRVLSSSTLR